MMESTTEWPATRRHRQSQLSGALVEEFPAVGNYSEIKEGLGFRRLMQALLKGYNAGNAPDIVLPELIALSRRAGTYDADSTDHVLLALACMEVVRQMPCARTWSYLWSLAWHDASLERNLPRAAIWIAQEDVSFKILLLAVAREVVENAVENPGWRTFTRDQNLFPSLREHWKQGGLVSIWWGLREARSVEFRADEGVFGIVATLDPNAFMHLLQRFDNPYPLPSALQAAGASWSFSKWKDLLSIAPVAFEKDRSWNGSAIAPLLLVIARERTLESQVNLRPEAPEGAVKEAAAETDTLAHEIAKVIAARPDAGPCAERWTAWLMRQSLGGISNEPLPYPSDARSRGYVDATLVAALGKELVGHTWSPSAAPDAEPWEDWMYRCVIVTLAAADLTSMPAASSFLDQWQLSPEEWSTARGQGLRERASLFEIFGKRADAYGTRLLAIPLAEASSPQDVWMHFWDITQTIRDVVEFGDPDGRLDHGLDTENAACELMRLAFGTGLMMLDCIVDPNRKIAGARQTSLEALFGPLASAVREMSAIDRFDRTYWSDALRHIAVRRAIWSEEVNAASTTFREATRPSFADFIAELSADTENLLALIEVALRNKVKAETLRQVLDKVGINLTDQIAFAERLIGLSQKRAGIGPVQVSAARSLLPP